MGKVALNPHWLEKEPVVEPEFLAPAPRRDLSAEVPADVQAEIQRLLGIKEKVLKMGRRMDGLLFNWVGLDPLLSLVPVFGDVASSGIKAYFLHQAHQARAPGRVMLRIGFYTVVDLSFAALPGVGDVLDLFFRSHAWSARTIAQHVDAQLILVEEAKARVEAGAAPAVEWQKVRTVLL